MRKSWEIKKLGEVCEIINGRNQSQVANPNGKYPIYGSGGIMGYADDFLCGEGSTIIGRKGTINRPLFVETKFWNVDTAFGFSALNSLNKRFLYFFCLGFDFKSLDKGTTLPSLTKKDLLQIDIPIPPLPEQQRIVSLLDEAIEAIDQAKANTERNLQNARELFQSELNRIFTNKGEGWVEKKLSEVALQFGRGKSKHRPRNDAKLYGGKYPFIQTGDVRNTDRLITSYTQTYSEIGLAQSKLWPQGTICITIAANIAETGILCFDSCFPDSIIGLVCDPNKADTDFAYYALQYLKGELQRLGKGSAQDNINLGTFENQRFPFPAINEQIKVVSQLNSLSEETKQLEANYQKKLNGLEELKKSILQKAFSGELTRETTEIQMEQLDMVAEDQAMYNPNQ